VGHFTAQLTTGDMGLGTENYKNNPSFDRLPDPIAANSGDLPK